MLRLSAISFATAMAAITAAFAEDVPYATRPGHPVAALSELMGKIQFRHMKIWQALQARNWELLNYELSQTRESFDSAIVLYESIPIELIVAADKALGGLQTAAKAKAAPNVERGFAELTAACNSCHQAAQVGFIVMKTPGPSPFGDQEFAPTRK
jgi:hypothetical protein